MTQVKLLSCVGMMYSGDERQKALAKGARSDLTSFCELDWRKLSECSPLLSDNPDQINARTGKSGAKQKAVGEQDTASG